MYLHGRASAVNRCEDTTASGRQLLDGSGKLYVLQAGIQTQTITVYPPNAKGNVSPVATIVVSHTFIPPQGMTVDRSGTIYVANFAANGKDANIIVFAPGSNGNAAPVRSISGSATQLREPGALALDVAGNLYVANAGSVLVFAPGANGNVAPSAVLAGPATSLGSVVALALNGAGDLYVASVDATRGGGVGQHIAIFPPDAHGNVPPLMRIGGSNTQLTSGQVTALAVTPPGLSEWSNTIFASNGNGTILEYNLSTVIPCRLRERCPRDPELNLSPTNTLTPEAIIPGTAGVAQPANVFTLYHPPARLRLGGHLYLETNCRNRRTT
jgi:hypothetical protein